VFLSRFAKTTSFCLDLLVSICSPLSSTREKDIICPRHFNYNGFSYTRKNVNQKNVSYLCQHRRGKKCNAELHFKRDKSAGKVDFDNKIRLGQHTRPCCIVNGVDPEDYDYDGKPKANEQGDDMLSSEGSDEDNVHPNRKVQRVDNRSRPPDVSEDKLDDIRRGREDKPTPRKNNSTGSAGIS